jgi:hypothetical protein
MRKGVRMVVNLLVPWQPHGRRTQDKPDTVSFPTQPVFPIRTLLESSRQTCDQRHDPYLDKFDMRATQRQTARHLVLLPPGPAGDHTASAG